jgi:predicted HTH transcriptional regulator
MTKVELLEIIQNGENSGVEFKTEKVHPDSLAREMAAFLNLEGGHIFWVWKTMVKYREFNRKLKRRRMGNGSWQDQQHSVKASVPTTLRDSHSKFLTASCAAWMKLNQLIL